MFTINPNKNEFTRSTVRGLNPDLISLKGYEFIFGLYGKVKAQGKLSIALNPANGETMTIGDKIYTFQTSLTNTDGNIKIGGTLAETKLNVVAAINLTGQPGTQYALATRVNEKVTIADFVVNDAIITAKEEGTAGNSIVTTETMAGAGNQFDAATLGTYRAGSDYSNPDLVYAPWQSYTNNNKFTPSDPYHGYIRRGVSRLNTLWPASGNFKIRIPDSYGIKIKQIPKLGMSIMSKANVSLSSAIGKSSNTQIYKIIEISTNKGFALYYDGSASKLYGIAFTVGSDGALTAGTPVAINNTNCYEKESDVVKIDTDKVLVGYKDSLTTNYPKTAVVTVSGVTCTVAAGVQIVATATTQLKMCQIATDKAVIAFNAADLYACSVSVTTPSYGSAANISGATFTTLVQNGTNKFQIAYNNSGNYVAACTVATLAITVGTAVRVTNSGIAGEWNQHKLVQLDTDKIAYFTDSEDSAQGFNRDMYFLTISGTTTTIASSNHSGYQADTDVYAELISATKILLVKATERGCIVDVDLTNNRLKSRAGDEMPYIYMSGSNRISGTPSFNGGGNERWGKVGGFVFGMYQGADPTLDIRYAAFPVSLSIDTYLKDELKKTVTFDSPMLFAPLELNLDVNDYGADIKLKNPNAYELILLPETEGYCGQVILE